MSLEGLLACYLDVKFSINVPIKEIINPLRLRLLLSIREFYIIFLVVIKELALLSFEVSDWDLCSDNLIWICFEIHALEYARILSIEV